MKRAALFFVIIFSLSIFASAQARKGHFEIVKSEQGKYYFVLKSSNGQEVLKGFYYSTEEKARESVNKTRQLAADAVNFDPRGGGSQWYFFLKGSDGRAVAQSEHYTTEAAMKRGIESVRKTAVDAEIN